jgi:ribosomal RNA-processing protein 12
MVDDCKKHFRLKVRDIMIKLIRKFGFNIISNMIPISDLMMQKRLKNIRKIEARKQKFNELDVYKKNKNKIEKFNIKRKSKRYNNCNYIILIFIKFKNHLFISFEEILADSDQEFENDSSKKLIEEQKHKLKNKTWIQENEYNIIDFIDPTVAKHISSINL